MRNILVLLLIASTYAFASEAGDGESDIVQRTVNFLLFAGLIWYLVAQPVKNFFASRSNAVAEELNRVQEKLQESIAMKKEALAKISEAEKFAEELAVASKKENKVLNDKIMSQCEADLEFLAKQQEIKKEFETRTMVRNVVEKVVAETLEQSADAFDREAMASVIIKKVA
ncbi:MAG: F0F1 ATP synthase subunit B [Epsilonproteobacteria bacterium]|nr:F0F1 ATP synthase subunit B [Campylobacterota bacterium]